MQADEESKTQLYSALFDGKTVGDLDEKLLSLEKDVEGVVERLKKMR